QDLLRCRTEELRAKEAELQVAHAALREAQDQQVRHLRTAPADVGVNVRADWAIAPEYTVAVQALANERKVKAADMGVGIATPEHTAREALALPERDGM